MVSHEGNQPFPSWYYLFYTLIIAQTEVNTMNKPKITITVHINSKKEIIKETVILIITIAIISGVIYLWKK